MALVGKMHDMQTDDLRLEIEMAAKEYRESHPASSYLRVFVNPADSQPRLPRDIQLSDGSTILVLLTRTVIPGKLCVSDQVS